MIHPVPEDSIYRWGGRETGWNHTEETKELIRKRVWEYKES